MQGAALAQLLFLADAAAHTRSHAPLLVLLILNDTHENVGGTKMPDPYNVMLKSLGFLTLDMIQVLPFDCAYKESFDHLDALLLMTLVPLLLLGAAEAFTSFRGRFKKQRGSLSHSLAMWLNLIFVFLLPVISRRICQSFRCAEYGECVSSGEYQL